VYHHRRGTVKVLEEWSAGVQGYWSNRCKNASLHYSTTPIFQSLEESFPFQLARDAFIDDIFDSKLADRLAASTRIRITLRSPEQVLTRAFN
jgi:hypothetical protein